MIISGQSVQTNKKFFQPISGYSTEISIDRCSSDKKTQEKSGRLTMRKAQYRMASMEQTPQGTGLCSLSAPCVAAMWDQQMHPYYQVTFQSKQQRINRKHPFFYHLLTLLQTANIRTHYCIIISIQQTRVTVQINNYLTPTILNNN